MNFDYYNYKYIERMEYQKIINLLDNINNQPSKFRTKSCVEVNDDACGTCKPGGEIKFKTTIKVFDYSDAHILVTGTVRIVGVGNSDAAQGADKGNKPFTKCINQVNNSQTDDAERVQ